MGFKNHKMEGVWIPELPHGGNSSPPEIFMNVCMLNRFSHVQLFETLWIVAHKAPLSMRFSKQVWVAMLFSRESSQPKGQTCISYNSCIVGRFFTTEPPEKPRNTHRDPLSL